MTEDARIDAGERELAISLVLDTTPEKAFRCWTEPALMTRWFAPRPWSTPRAETDVRAGGSSLVVMASPEGQEFPNRGVYLEVVPNRKLVFTDAYVSAWEPAPQPFFTAIVTFEDTGDGRTRYTARARHWSDEACRKHEEMGFHPGWTQCARQLEEVARTL